MKASIETWYTADDGARFPSESAALAHEAKCADVKRILAPLGTAPDSSDFSNGGGYVPHLPETVRVVRAELGALTIKHHPWMGESLNKHPGTHLADVHPSWWGRMIDGSDDVLHRAWSRVYCIDASGREWGQPYFALHPTEGKQQEWRPADATVPS